ncbi:MAG: cellobiose phosphorylase [Candidatus Omnitrophota bacterium]
MKKNTLWKFIDNEGSFIAANPHKLSSLYFPLCSPKGLLSSITPSLSGDIKKDQHSFLLVPATTIDLKETRYNRNFWVMVNDRALWSAAKGSVTASNVEGGFLYHKLTRTNRSIGVQAEFLNFSPLSDEAIEIELITLKNISKKKLTIQATAAVPIFGRSADRLRDHRHVSSLLNRIKSDRYGVIVKPTMSFDERGHKVNEISYFVLGCDARGNAPMDIISSLEGFTGEEGNLESPKALTDKKYKWPKNTGHIQGKEAIGALRFKKTSLSPNKNISFIIIMGINKDTSSSILKRFNTKKKIYSHLNKNKTFWKNKVNSIKINTKDKDFDNWTKWVMLQPTLRKIFGCSFLPDFDYGRGGRGWRDLWQDCLTLILISPEEARKTLINNFSGVRIDGSNATIIGKKEGGFISDRNNISRVWMDHGLWPFKTLNLYINQTGDTSILFKKVPYFESKKKETILDHILRQHRRMFSKIGKHGNFLLEDGDWNDGLDMADKLGESVAFTAAYRENLEELASLLEKIDYKKDVIKELRKRSGMIKKNILKNEWINSKNSRFFNGYYDNLGKRVEGKNRSGIRMTLTGQVFPIMSGIADKEHIKEIYKSAKKYLWDERLKGFRLNTDFKEIYTDLGRAFGFIYGEKENGSFFSHMNVMFSYALYKRGFVKEGFDVLNSIYNMCTNTEQSKIYPGLPEYFNSEGKGMYHYLTGSASWFMLTLFTQVFGVRGDMGDLVIDPKLSKEQFRSSDKVSLETGFAGRRLIINYLNPKRLNYGKYIVKRININGKDIKEMPVPRKLFLKLTSKNSSNIINIYLNRQ